MSHPQPCVLVTGGAGYIGSHVVLALRDSGWRVVVLDNLSTGFAGLLPPDVPLVVAEVGDEDAVVSTIETYGVSAILHMAGAIVVPESVVDPLKYYQNNMSAGVNLLRAATRYGVDKVLFSSTAAVYGEGDGSSQVNESAPVRPTNPYGFSKLMFEQVLRDTAAAGNLRFTILRYFNVAGADPAKRTGQCSPFATHLIKVACECSRGLRDELTIFGRDYDTPDGTCIRDYIHVSDLAEAHAMALAYLREGGESQIMNCGYGRGYSVLEVMRTIEAVSGRPIRHVFGERRPGDVPRLVADARKIRDVLGWKPRFQDLQTIVSTALNWEEKLHAGSPLRAKHLQEV